MAAAASIREPSALASARTAAVRHAAMLANAGALATGTLVGALCGFAYWWLAARSFSPTAVGLAAAAVSMMNLLGHVGEVGLGPFLIGRISRTDDAPALVATALLTAAASCLAIGIAYVGLDRMFNFGLGGILRDWSASAAFVVGVALTGFTLVLDQALVGLLRATTPMWRNVSFALIKLALLALAAFAWGKSAREETIFMTWLVGLLASLALAAAWSGIRRRSIWHAPRLALLRPLAGEVMGHHVLNVALQAPALALPFVVTIVLSPATNAPFYAAWSLVNVVLLVPASVTTVLYSTGAREPEMLASRLKLSVALSAALGLAAGVGLLLFSPFVLGLFSPAYPGIAGTSLRLLGFGTLGVMVKYHYVALRRLAGHTVKAAALLAVGGVFELALAAVGGRLGGLTGLTEGWLAAVLLEAALMLPCVVTAARSPAAVPATIDDVLSPPAGLGVA